MQIFKHWCWQLGLLNGTTFMQAPFPRRRPFQRYNYGMNRRDYYEPGYYQPRGYGRGGPRGGRSRGRGGRGQGGYRRTNKVSQPFGGGLEVEWCSGALPLSG